MSCRQHTRSVLHWNNSNRKRYNCTVALAAGNCTLDRPIENTRFHPFCYPFIKKKKIYQFFWSWSNSTKKLLNWYILLILILILYFFFFFQTINFVFSIFCILKHSNVTDVLTEQKRKRYSRVIYSINTNDHRTHFNVIDAIVITVMKKTFRDICV